MGKKKKYKNFDYKLNDDNIKPLSNSKEENIDEDMVSFTDYDLDKVLKLGETKKIDVEKIFEKNNSNYQHKKRNIWCFLTFILFIIVASLTMFYIKLQHNYQNLKTDYNNLVDNSGTIEKDNKEEQPKDDDKTNNKKEKYVFLGDSIFEQYNVNDFFNKYDVVNSGTSGITAKKTLEELDKRVYQHNPTTVFILLGTNDLYFGYTVRETCESLKSIIDKIRSERPEITINVLSVLPINLTDDPKINKEANNNRDNDKINEINKYLKDYCDKIDINYINVHDILLDDNGNLKLDYTREGLHITDLGYYHISIELLKYMEE